MPVTLLLFLDVMTKSVGLYGTAGGARRVHEGNPLRWFYDLQ